MNRETGAGLQLRTRDGTVLDVPVTLNAITTYVLLEQERWFEKELEFLLAFLKPSMTAIDIGANLGVYALPLARRVKRVVAYEPGGEARGHLEKSRALNGVGNLEIVAAAVSDSVREGRLVKGGSSEISRLESAALPQSPLRPSGPPPPQAGEERKSAGEGEAVAVTALDHEDRARDWSPDFVKVDAEGEEVRIIEGGRAFFARHSPVVMFEVRTEGAVNVEAVRAFEAMGYGIYRSLPGLPVLVRCGEELAERAETAPPFRPHGDASHRAGTFPHKGGRLETEGARLGGRLETEGDLLDPSELNLFAVKAERADELKARGLLIDEARAWTPDDEARADALSLMKAQPYAAPYAALFDVKIERAYVDALAGFAAWRRSRDYGALLFALRVLDELCEAEPGMARLSSLARVAWEAGKRELAVKCLASVRATIRRNAGALNEPFWPASRERDEAEIAPQHWGEWFITQALEQEERIARYSSYWGSSDVNLAWLASHKWVSTEMLRRHVLGVLTANPAAAIPERLCVGAADHVNAQAWRSGLVRVAARGESE